jgi:NADP-dependent 3-hydroxy acid dehydrogenase YdfG
MSKTIMVTGASKGIGRAVALEFAKNGFHVAANARGETELNALKKEIEQFGQKVFVMPVDVTNRAENTHFIEEAFNHFGGINVLVNNVGVFNPGSILDEQEKALEEMMDTNLYSTYQYCREVIPRMKKKGGYVFNVCSTASITPYLNGGSYCITKYAQYGLTKVLREELKESSIRVSAVLPGATLTHSWEGTELPKERFMEAESIAKMMVTAYNLPSNTVMEEILMRPQLGDI